MPVDSLQGPLTFEDLQAVWEGAVDREYARPLIAAGEGGGFEVYTQAFTQIARASAAVDRTFQQVYIQPWSGQSGSPASGPGYAVVELTISRGSYLERPLVLVAGQVVVDEVQDDHSPSGTVPTNTGRRYVLQENAVFAPGDRGPVTVLAQAAKPGYGYNNPLPGSIAFVENVGTGLGNDLATLTENAGAPVGSPATPALSYLLTAYNEPDMFSPSNVGQYVLFTKGANAGATALVTGFTSPSGTRGSAVALAPLLAFESFDVSEPFLVGGSPVRLLDSGSTVVAVGALLGISPGTGGGEKFVILLLQGDATTAVTMGQAMVPPAAGGSCTVDVVLASAKLAPEAPSGVPLSGGSTWIVLEWANDWLVEVSNVSSPAGGALGLLDLIGNERKLPRQRDEDDDTYRDRLWNVADVVSPNAVKRALFQTLGAVPWCYRETNDGSLPGLFYDRGLSPPGEMSGGDPDGDFYDDDMLLWEGVVASGAFNVGDPVVYQRQVPAGTGPWLTQATGTFGGFIGARQALVAAASNGKALPQPTVYVDDVVGWPTSGQVVVEGTTVTYAGVDPTNVALTGCTGGTGTLSTGDAVALVGEHGFAAAGTMQFVRKSGQSFEVLDGDRILDKRTGAIFTPSSGVENDWAVIRRWHVYLSYADMRAYFLVEVQPVNYGEFGFAYDSSPLGAYDAAPFDAFYDGYPVGQSALLTALYNQLNAVRAGGVGFDVVPSGGPCV